MNPFADAGLDEKGEDGLAEGGAGASMASIELLYPEARLLAYTVYHGGLSDAWRANQQKGGMGAILYPFRDGLFDFGVQTRSGLFG